MKTYFNTLKRIASLYCCTLLLFTTFVQAQTRHLERDMILVRGAVDTVYIDNPEYFENPEATDVMGYYAVSEIEDFYMAAYCVSELDYLTFCKATKRDMPPAPSRGWGDYKKPMVNVSYQDAQDFCRWLTDSLGVPFRLPSGHEWEFAANEGRFYDSVYEDVITNIDAIAEHKDNNREKGTPGCISCKQPNSLGLYNMLGNVWELITVQQAKGGSFLSPREALTTQATKSVSTTEIAEDMGFRIVANAGDFKKYLIAQEANRLTYFIFGNHAPFWFSAKGIHNGNETIPRDLIESFFIDVSEYHAGFTVYTTAAKRKTYEKFPFAFPKEKIKEVVRLQEYMESNFWEK